MRALARERARLGLYALTLLRDTEIREAAAPSGASYRAPRSHTRPHDDDIASLSPGTTIQRLFSPARYALSSPVRLARSRSFSLYRLPLVGPKRRRWRLITTQSPLPVRPGLRPVPRKQQPPFAALGHSPPPRYRCCKTNNLRPVPRKKERRTSRLPYALRAPRSPPPFRQITGGPTDRSDYWHPENPSRG